MTRAPLGVFSAATRRLAALAAMWSARRWARSLRMVGVATAVSPESMTLLPATGTLVRFIGGRGGGRGLPRWLAAGRDTPQTFGRGQRRSAPAGRRRFVRRRPG